MTRTWATIATVAPALVDGSEKTNRAPPLGRLFVPDPLTVGLDERLGDGEPEPGAAACAELGEPVKDRLAICRRGTPGP